MIERDNAEVRMLKDPSESNKCALTLKQRKPQQITRKSKRIVGH